MGYSDSQKISKKKIRKKNENHAKEKKPENKNLKKWFFFFGFKFLFVFSSPFDFSQKNELQAFCFYIFFSSFLKIKMGVFLSFSLSPHKKMFFLEGGEAFLFCEFFGRDIIGNLRKEEARGRHLYLGRRGFLIFELTMAYKNTCIYILGFFNVLLGT